MFIIIGAHSSIHHTHTDEEEFVYILEGNPTLFWGEKEEQLGI